MKRLLLCTALAITFSMPSMAQETVALPEGHTALNISATEKVEVEQDLLIATLRIEHEAKSSKEVQEYINDHMKRAMAEIKKMPSVKVETGGYYVRPNYRYINKPNGNNERVLDKWRGSQTVTMKSEASDDILKLAGELQDMHFMMNGLNYQLSPAKYDEVRDGLMETTVEALMNRAKRVAKALGKSQVDLVEINVDAGGGYRPKPIYARAAKMEMMASADSSMPAPTAEAGETTVTMSVNARAIIKP
jgi:predicted secreted protein